jgi:ubiquinone/menaquinone biosynthesis C-methylase UbiE
MTTKDLFSGHSQIYAAFRPTYPEELYECIFSHVDQKSIAWDCATGNGQAAQRLAKDFEKVFATDISQKQIDQAFRAENIVYSVSKAEETNFTDNQFDLITVGQAIHWIDTSRFYSEVIRTSKQNATLAIWGYSLLSITPEIDSILLEFYTNVVGKYWDEARKLVDNKYRDIPFPFEQIKTPEFQLKVSWTLDHLAGYLTSWSATQRYIQSHSTDPVPQVIKKISSVWEEGEHKQAIFPLFLKLGKVAK